jgi:hypothetical protein
MNPSGRAAIATALSAALAVALGSTPFEARADTRSDYSIFCIDLISNDPGVASYPSSTNSNSGTHLAGGGSFSWDLFSDGWMPGPGIPYLTQGADAWAEFQGVTIPFGSGCQFFSGTESRIVIHGIKPSAPAESGTAPAQIRVHYHVILENEYAGSGANVGAVNGVSVNAPSQFGTANLILNDSGGAPALTVPNGTTITDVSIGPLTRKDLEGELVINDTLDYGALSANLVDITFFSGAQFSTEVPAGVLVTAQAASMAGETAVTDVTSLDPAVEFTVVVPEPGAGALAAVALSCLSALGARRRR